ncbi:hypothetical protein [Parenemella sanctibonifatiensis]|uniref:Uncharacterized protein n=1 Tax=Parenemella sanctibonifatiensis TaxID=2016505 RepID=A0A255EF00_9ACTN|nr:hypothetical protein [Parenemella sanctibonifatiensis]OYN89810.1 hypothetical protein CGZ91_09875 [Parenemella sanctibonifatiensis]
MEVLLIFGLVILVVGGGIGLYFGIRRYQYVKALESRGWTFVTNPDISIANGLNVPPFGVEYDRSVDDQIIGKTADGLPFQVFEYQTRNQREIRVTCIRLPYALPEFVLGNGPVRPHLVAYELDAPGALRAFTSDTDFGREALRRILPSLPTNTPIDISIDGNQLVSLHCPEPAEEMNSHIEQAATYAKALMAGGGPEQFKQPDPEPKLGFYHTKWTYFPRADHFLEMVSTTGGGQNHRAQDVVIADNDGLPFIALAHHWETTHTTSNGNGGTTTTTQHHVEYIVEMQPPFPFRFISLNWGIFSEGKEYEYESEKFNEKFKIRTHDPKFASDVIHPRAMEWLMAYHPVPFAIRDGVIRFKVNDHEPPTIIYVANQMHGLFGWVPSFVWANLGVRPSPTFRELPPIPGAPQIPRAGTN